MPSIAGGRDAAPAAGYQLASGVLRVNEVSSIGTSQKIIVRRYHQAVCHPAQRAKYRGRERLVPVVEVVHGAWRIVGRDPLREPRLRRWVKNPACGSRTARAIENVPS